MSPDGEKVARDEKKEKDVIEGEKGAINENESEAKE